MELTEKERLTKELIEAVTTWRATEKLNAIMFLGGGSEKLGSGLCDLQLHQIRIAADNLLALKEEPV